MAYNERHEEYVNYGKTDGENLPHLQKGLYFCVGYNDTHGLVDAMKGDGTPQFEGNVPIEDLLSEIPEDKNRIDQEVEEHIMLAHDNYHDHKKNPEKYDEPPTPRLEVKSYEA